MLTTVCILIVTMAGYCLAKPILRYYSDTKGFRKYPTQNLFSGFTNWAYCWEVGRKDADFHTRRLHKRLMKDPIVRVGPNWLSFSSPKAVRDIYGYSSPCQKAAIYDALQGGGQNLVNISSRSLHSSRRRMVAAAYAPKNIDVWSPKVARIVSALLDKMDALCTKPLLLGSMPSCQDLTFDANLWSMLYTFEATISIGLSKSVGFIEQGSDLFEITHSNGITEKVHTIECLHSASRATSTLIWDTPSFSLLKKISKLVSSWYAGQWRSGEKWRAVVAALMQERVKRYERGETLDDLFQPMMEDKKTGEEPRITALDRLAEVDQMINGGGDGPGISLVNTIYYLIKNPLTLERLRVELDAALSHDDRVAPWSKVKNLPYLRACVDESMRLSPPVATDLVRITPPDRPYTVDDEILPAGTTVSISAYTAHRDPSLFPDPENFKPERWMTKGNDNLKDMLAVYIPFSAGSRSCIGRNVTSVMQLVFLATLIHRYEFALPSPDWEMEWTDYFNLWPNELPLKVWRRE